jgi:hypothetical protein
MVLGADGNFATDMREALLSKRPITPGYIIFYILFSPDTWRALGGLSIAYFLTPLLAPQDLGTGGQVMLYIMLAVIGYVLLAVPARWLTQALRKAILGPRA